MSAIMKPFESYIGRNRSRLRAERVESCVLTQVYHAYIGRNAWHNRWIQRYILGSSFCSSLAEARRHAEANRSRGSNWAIEELPACAFVGPSLALIVTEINTLRPLQRFRRIIPAAADLLSIGDQFRPVDPNTVVRLIVPSESVAASKGPFKHHRSTSSGGYRYWFEQPGLRSHDVTAVRKQFLAFLAASAMPNALARIGCSVTG